MAEREVELKNLLKKVTEESEKAGLKLNIEKTKIMTSGPIPSWKVDGETKETVTDFLFLGSQTHCWWWTAAIKLKETCPLEEKLWLI